VLRDRGAPRPYLSDSAFDRIVEMAGGTPHELNVLRSRLEEIIELYQDAKRAPRTEYEAYFDEFSKPSPLVREKLKRVQKSCNRTLEELRDADVAARLRSVAPDKSVSGLKSAVQAIHDVKTWAGDALKIETRGRKRDEALDTALLELANTYVQHFRHGDIWKVPSSERSRFVRFAGEVLSHTDGLPLTEEVIAKRWQRLRNEMSPLRVRLRKSGRNRHQNSQLFLPPTDTT
jgi:hypothetical protein